MRQNNRETGSRYEEQAAVFLTQEGYEILERNFRCKSGEIDLICKEGSYLVFVEVKYRSSGESGDPAEAVGLRKQKKIIDTARYYLYIHKYQEDTPCRFDVVAILEQDIRVIRDAFWRI